MLKYFYRPQKLHLIVFPKQFITSVPHFVSFKSIRLHSHSLALYQPFSWDIHNNGISKKLYHSGASTKSNAQKVIESLIEEGNHDRAFKVYKESKSDFSSNDTISLLLANNLIDNGRLSDAKTVLTNVNSNEKSHTTDETNALLKNIFTKLIDQVDLDELSWFVDNLIFSYKYMDRKLLAIVMQHYLNKCQDLHETVDLFTRIAEQFHVTPMIHVLTCNLVVQNDTENLEKILSISTRIHGQENSFYSMAFAFTSCNRIDQAKKIFISLNTAEKTDILENHVQHLKLRRQSTNLRRLISATEDCIPSWLRQDIYVTLLELYIDESAADDITDIIKEMETEHIIPYAKSNTNVEKRKHNITRISKAFQRMNITMPNSWQLEKQFDDDEIVIRDFLHQNNIKEANQLLINSFELENPLGREVIRYCLKKNAENGQTEIFEELKLKLDVQTKQLLQFSKFECEAYYKSGRCKEYITMIESLVKKSQGDLKEIAVGISDCVIDMIQSCPDIYKSYINLAKIFADKGVLKPICIAWAYNFINNTNSAENVLIWNKYLQRHPTIVCNQITRILMNRRLIEKLQIFLNYDRLNKERIAKSEIGKSFSILFDDLYHKGEYDTIVTEFQKNKHILSVKDLKPNTLNRIKYGPPSLQKLFSK